MTTDTNDYSDLPTTRDELGFAPAAQALTRIVQDTAIADTPLTLGIYGAWGSGKISLMQMMLSGLDPQHVLPVWFDAWRYAQSETLWRALLLAIVEELRLSTTRPPGLLRNRRFTRAIACISPCPRIGLSTYIVCRLGASKPVSYMSRTITTLKVSCGSRKQLASASRRGLLGMCGCQSGGSEAEPVITSFVRDDGVKVCPGWE